MNTLRTKYLLFLFLSLCSYFTFSQPFKDAILEFQRMDSISMPKKGSILFVGSSSFTNWKDIQDYFPTYPIINRGFGGSTLPDVIRYAQETIVNYAPKQIYIYCGENDIAADPSISVDTILNRFKIVYTIIRKKLKKNTPIVYVSMKPSLARWNYESKIVEANRLIKQFIETQKNILFLDVHSAMLDPDGMVKADIFLEDQLHMNAKGYTIWQGIIAPTLSR
jgi:lysophospholipase L1-like esterase